MKFLIHKQKGIYITDRDEKGNKLGYLWIGTDNECFGYIDGVWLKKLESWFCPDNFKRKPKTPRTEEKEK